MPAYLNPHQIHIARQKTATALGLSENTPISANEANVSLKYLLLERLDKGEIRYWRKQWQNDAGILLRKRLETALAEILAVTGIADNSPETQWILLAAAPLYRQRVVDLTLEAIISEPLAPELCIKINPVSSLELPGNHKHAILFAAAVCFSHELYPLSVDAYEHDCMHYGKPRTAVLGAHVDWLTEDGALRRVIYLDVFSGRLIETELIVPVQADSIQFLCLGKHEQQLHPALSQRFACLQVNPAPAAQLADDKAATLAAWSALGLDVPDWQTIALGKLDTAFGFFDRFAEIVVKPNQSTEGELVAFFQHGQYQAKALLENHLQHCWAQGHVIMQQRRDGVGFRDPATGGHHSLALRLNLVSDGERYCVESGYAQLGADRQQPAACGCGGNIIAIAEAVSGLVYKGKPIGLTGKDWRNICLLAGQAASLFDGLLLLGLDVLLDIGQNGNITPVFLEANPRPAGLSHSRFSADDPHVPTMSGVSLKLWGIVNNA